MNFKDFLHPATLAGRVWNRLSSIPGPLLRDIRQVPPALIRIRKSGKRPYVLPNIPYMHNSAGRRACHRLIHDLNAAGYTAFSLGAVNPRWSELPLTRFGLFLLMMFSEPVVIYPEVVHGNPLGAKLVVRWTLNVPGRLGGDTSFDESELVFTWMNEFYPTDRVLTRDIFDRSLFNSDDLPEKDVLCYYLGKGSLRGVDPLSIADGMVQITRDWPPDRHELAELLRRTKILYTYDDLTMLTFEALQCGCQVVLLPEHRELSVEEPLCGFIDEDHEIQLDRFITETQGEWPKPLRTKRSLRAH